MTEAYFGVAQVFEVDNTFDASNYGCRIWGRLSVFVAFVFIFCKIRSSLATPYGLALVNWKAGVDLCP